MTEAAKNSLRNRLAWRVANAALRIADPTYRQWLAGMHRYGINAAVRDAREGREAPQDYREKMA